MALPDGSSTICLSKRRKSCDWDQKDVDCKQSILEEKLLWFILIQTGHKDPSWIAQTTINIS